MKIRQLISKALSLPYKGAGSGDYSRERYADYFNQLPAPTVDVLIQRFRRTAYTCARINANACARIKLKLYVTTAQHEKRTQLDTKSIDSRTIDDLQQRLNITKAIKNIEEVVSHPVLDVLQLGNPHPLVNGYKLRIWRQLYQEITGKAYLLVRDNLFGIPSGFWVVPSQYMEPKTYESSNNIIDYYKYTIDHVERKFSVDEIMFFNMADLNDPYTGGISPLEACYEKDTVVSKLVSIQQGMLDREARPDMMLIPEEGIGEEEAARWEKQYMNKFGRGRRGGIYIPEEKVTLEAINYPPRDLAALEIEKLGRNEICNCFDVPIPLLDSEKVGKQVLEGALEQHARISISPRLEADQAVLNDQLIPRYDDTGRLILVYDNPIPEDKEVYMTETVNLKMNGIITPNEARDRHNYPPMEGGDEREVANVAGSGERERDDSRKNGTADK